MRYSKFKFTQGKLFNTMTHSIQRTLFDLIIIYRETRFRTSIIIVNVTSQRGRTPARRRRINRGGGRGVNDRQGKNSPQRKTDCLRKKK